MKRRPSFDEAEYEMMRKRHSSGSLDGFGESVPTIRTEVPSAPGSDSSARAARRITDPMRAGLHRKVMLALAAAGRPLSREELSAATGIKEATLCARISTRELRPEWVCVIEDACVSEAGMSVDGYTLTDKARARMATNSEAA